MHGYLHHVILQYMNKGNLKTNRVHLEDHEYATVKLLVENGYDVELIPPSQIKGLRTPDITLNNVPWEMKSPQGDGKRTIMNTIQNASHQCGNLIIDLRRCRLDENQAISEIEYHFRLSKRIRNLKVIRSDKTIIDLSKK